MGQFLAKFSQQVSAASSKTNNYQNRKALLLFMMSLSQQQRELKQIKTLLAEETLSGLAVLSAENTRAREFDLKSSITS